MKVVQELVSYFDRQGQLSQKQLRKLLDQGFLAADAPVSVYELCDNVGASFYFRVTGAIEGQVWGTGIYTADSPIAAAAVHAGLVKPAESAVVKMTAVAAPSSYSGSKQNGIETHDFGRYAYAYKLSAI